MVFMRVAAATDAPGIIGKAKRLFITSEDVEWILGCGKSKAYEVVRKVNDHARKKGQMPFPAGRASKYLFADLYGIPIEDVDKVING